MMDSNISISDVVLKSLGYMEYIPPILSNLNKLAELAKEFSQHQDINDISQLIEHINKSKNIKQRELKITGTFFPATLLYPGWWDRKGVEKKSSESSSLDLSGCNDLQRWLFEGFQLWGPSLDISLPAEDEKPYMLAQLAGGDEAESVSLIISKDKAKDIREAFLKEKKPIIVEVTGTLFHRDDNILEGIKESLDIPIALSDYCIVVRTDEKHHEVKRVGVPDFYTGYLWQCWVPESVAKSKQQFRLPALNEVYFCWEHTNLAKSDALAYNLDSLARKKEFIEREMQCGKLVLAQKSSLVVPDNPLYPADVFYRAIFE